ncbi:SIMPL domain-containing protein [Anianabacter salinae]|uniref:SIMPL domain-containing protein n=1 Tax=Anianabacter salinae TaxID=2851023 RepID=UPI00225E4B96|nr:SIMPL domain-containing protein [Anianabacter salinae]MBV0911612.1 SIMPL domain-containing protein [Anianabacter salinae]
MRWIVLFLGLALTTPAAAQSVSSGQITVTGEGRVQSVPDMAQISLGVVTEAEGASEAMAQTSERADAIIAALTETGIAERDMQTSDLSLNPIWAEDRTRPEMFAREIVGFSASTNLRVRVRNLDTLGTVMDAVLQVGANNFQGLSFGLADPEPVLDEARKAAVADARRKAELLAEAAGVSLGAITSIREGSQGDNRPMMMEAAMMRDSGPVARGEVETSAQVTLVWAIAPGAAGE